MELSFTAGLIVLTLLYVFRKPIKQKAEDVERDMKVNSAESGIDTAKRVIQVNQEIDDLGDIPNIDDVLKRLNGHSHKQPINERERTED